MPIKEIKPKQVSNIFPLITDGMIGVIYPPVRRKDNETIEEVLTELKKRRLLDIERKAFEKELDDEKAMEVERPESRRYTILNNQIVRDDDGEYTLNEAVKVLSTQRGTHESAIVELARAMKELRPGESLDIAKVVSDIKALVPVPPVPEITRNEIELLIKNQQLQTQQIVERLVQELKETFNKDRSNDLVTRLTTIWQSLPESVKNRLETLLVPQPGHMYRDGQGNILPLPDWLQVKRLEVEIEEKAEAAKFKQGLIRTAQTYAPEILATLRSIRGEKSKVEEVLEKSGWGKQGEFQGDSKENLTKEIVSQLGLLRLPCGACGKELVCTSHTVSTVCPHCKTVNALQKTQSQGDKV